MIHRRYIINLEISCAIAFLFLLPIEYFFGKNLNLLNNAVIGKIKYVFPAIIIFLRLIKQKLAIKSTVKFLMFLLLLTLSAVLTSQYNHNINFAGFYVECSYIVTAIVLISYPESHIWVERLLYCIHIEVLIYLLWLKQYTADGIQVTNYISVYYIIYLTILAFQRNKLSLSISLIHPLLAFFFSLIAMGRGGILSTFILNILLLLFSRSSSRKWIVFSLSSVFIAFIALLYMLNFSFDTILPVFYNKGFTDSGRIRFWSNYINECNESIPSMIFGVNIENHLSHYLYYTPPHLHNSYLTFYGMFGIILMLLIVILSTCFLFRLLKEKKYILFSYIFVFFIRSFTDVVFGDYCGDIVLYMIIFSVTSEKILMHRKKICYC